MKNITIIGGGEIGSALFHLLRIKKYAVHLFDRKADKALSKISLEDALLTSEIIFICVPSRAFVDVIQSITSKLKPHTLLVSLTKGFVDKTHTTYDVLNNTRCAYALLSGPMLAEEILDDKLSMAIVASESTKHFNTLSKVFSSTPLSLWHSKNVRAVSLVGILKNVYSLAMGIGYGLQEMDKTLWSDNAHGFLVTRCVHEMKTIVSLYHEDSSIVDTLAGIGDFFATGTSHFSSNSTNGKLLAQGKTPTTCEGIVSLPTIASLFKNKKKLPVLDALIQIIDNKKNPERVFINLTTTPF